MRYILVGLALISWFNMFSQDNFDNEYNLIKSNIDRPFETIRTEHFHSKLKSKYSDSLFIDYIIRKYSSDKQYLKRYISYRPLLVKFSELVLKRYRAKLKLTSSEDIEVDIDKGDVTLSSLGEVVFDSSIHNPSITSEYFFKYITSVNLKKAYGLIFDTSVVSKIINISIKVNGEKFLMKKDFYDDLFFPNLCETFYFLKPVEAYLSSNRKYVYLYLFGGQETAMYFCKIIIDLEAKRVIGRMIADETELRDFQCSNSLHFIGF